MLEWLYGHRVTEWQAMTNLPCGLREKLQEHYSFNALELVRTQGSRDTTQKFLWKLSDGALIESVLIPANPALYGEPSDRHTLCVSTQVGCAYGCKFCASGIDGWKRNLRPEEIVEQILAVERWHARTHTATPPEQSPCAEAGRAEALGSIRPAPSPEARRINNLAPLGVPQLTNHPQNILKGESAKREAQLVERPQHATQQGEVRIRMVTQMDTRASNASYLTYPTFTQLTEKMVPGVGIEPTCPYRGRGF